MKRDESLRRTALRLTLLLFDIFAVNFSYYMALVLRFYVNHEFHIAWTQYMPVFLRFAPWYTVCCVAVFWLLRLYNGMWRFAGFGDINRVVMANAVTCAIHIIGTMLLTGDLPVSRMPITYYTIGAAIQFVLIFASRFSYRIVSVELRKISQSRESSVNVMIVGAGETARLLLRQIESDRNSLMRPVCVLDTHSAETGRLFDGLPVVAGMDGAAEAFRKHDVKSLVIADPMISTANKTELKRLCQEIGVEVQDFSGYLRVDSASLSLRQLMEHTSCPVTVMSEGQAQTFENGEDALSVFSGKQDIKDVKLRDNRLLVELVTYRINPLVTFYITNRPDVALIAEKYGVDRIWIDLETLGKEERQRNMNTVKSHHTVADIAAIKPLLTKAELLVRVNSWYEGSREEIDAVIANGADIIMLPYWKTVQEVDNFLAAVNGRCRTTLLLETKEAVECVDEVLKRKFDEIHIGLNDLSISYGMTFMFELLANGTVEMLCEKFKKAGVPYGFGGIAKLGNGLLPAEKIIMEHYRLGSTRAILSRTFCDQAKPESIEEIDWTFRENMAALKEYELSMAEVTQEDFIRNKMEIAKAVDEIVAQITRARSNEA